MYFTITKIGVIIFLMIFSLLFWYYHDNKVNSLELEIQTITYERDNLLNKINTIEESLADLGKVKPRNKTSPTKTTSYTEKNKVLSVKNQKVDYANDVKNNPQYDDIISMFPNRTGQDLVNSLKLKTEL
jgi:hypothetical protein